MSSLGNMVRDNDRISRRSALTDAGFTPSLSVGAGVSAGVAAGGTTSLDCGIGWLIAIIAAQNKAKIAIFIVICYATRRTMIYDIHFPPIYICLELF